MIFLIVNADDLGSGPERDRGILEAFQYGIVTSASLLANGPSFASAALLSNRAGLPVGVHLNLADGFTLSGPIAGLTDADGRLPGKPHLRLCLTEEKCDLAAIRRELSAQIERVFATGLQPDHLNSHQHCQLFPCLNKMVVELAREYGVGAVRQPRPMERAENDPDGILGEELALYRRLASVDLETDDVLARPDGLWGMSLLNRLDQHTLCALLETIPAGRWELMTHPGYAAPDGDAFGDDRRNTERQALCAPEARAIINRRDIQLGTFGELPCAS